MSPSPRILDNVMPLSVGHGPGELHQSIPSRRWLCQVEEENNTLTLIWHHLRECCLVIDTTAGSRHVEAAVGKI